MAELAWHDLSDGAVPLLECKFDRSSLAELRGELARCGDACGLAEPRLPNFVLAVNEIATNAVRYAGGTGELRLWRAGEELCCLVADHGPGIPPRHLDHAGRPRPEHVGGHGLWLARHICDSVEIRTGRAAGTRVLLRYRLRPTDS